ncbi:glycosyltransferase family 4 protein [Oceanidesulfovibrio marinus]|uniref:Glycosyltransferase family 4 protein n=1 Tax=Oceanidesulfovibrio marinus TaxID=370038 RepID=A0ABX6NLK0_9BACT|nr:glycosyltransferase family 4 protein [Oceanidesulfovibrio marinus]QJT11096.1 glycosyltransferase family 4 protein [Oceanidesulfovibrio marinus]
MKIFVTGLRGFPDVPGGVERHCEELYPRIAAMGHEVVVAVRAPYQTYPEGQWKGVVFESIDSPTSTRFEAITHTCKAMFAARRHKPDIVHIHAIGPSLMVPVGRLLGMRVVSTHHGHDYNRDKWGGFAKRMLKLGERLGCKFSNRVIVISESIRDALARMYNCRRTTVIPNGVTVRPRLDSTTYLQSLGVEPGKYVLAVSRLVPEKGLHDLVAAFDKISGDIKLVIAGDSDHDSQYRRNLFRTAEENERLVMPGYVRGDDLAELYSHARLFVLPSYHEGLPIVALEAMSYGLPLLLSDIVPNKDVGLPERYYYPVGDVDALAQGIGRMLGEEHEEGAFEQMVREKYDWDLIARQTEQVYREVAGG